MNASIKNQISDYLESINFEESQLGSGWYSYSVLPKNCMDQEFHIEVNLRSNSHFDIYTNSQYMTDNQEIPYTNNSLDVVIELIEKFFYYHKNMI